MRRSALLVCVLAGIAVPCGFALGQETQYTVSPDNQPKDSAPVEVMRAYSDMNGRLADGAEEPASSCLKSYAVYQTCKGGDTSQSCGAAPSCTAVAALPVMDLSGIIIHFSAAQDTAMLTPRMSGINQMVVLNGSPTPIKMLKNDAAPRPVQPSAPVAGTSEMSGGIAAPSGIIAEPGPLVVIKKPIGPVRISGGVLAGNRVSSVTPVYPTVAKLAHLSGMVVLRAIISKAGTIESLQVSSATSPMFVNSAIDAVRRWIYRPYLLNDQATEVDTTITVNYSLNPPTNVQPSGQELPR
jgi:TonB family protein